MCEALLENKSNHPCIKHGYYKTKLYEKWEGIKARCKNPNSKEYKNYGGRGISMCDEWLNNPVAFIEWALKSGYKRDLTIDRIDVNGNYDPSNCRWVTLQEQARNRRDNLRIKVNGKTLILSEIARLLNVHCETVRRVYLKGGDKKVEQMINEGVDACVKQRRAQSN